MQSMVAVFFCLFFFLNKPRLHTYFVNFRKEQESVYKWASQPWSFSDRRLSPPGYWDTEGACSGQECRSWLPMRLRNSPPHMWYGGPVQPGNRSRKAEWNYPSWICHLHFNGRDSVGEMSPCCNFSHNVVLTSKKTTTKNKSVIFSSCSFGQA